LPSVSPVITGITTHVMFHIRCISIHKLLYFSSTFAAFCVTFLSAVLIATSINIHVLSFLFLIIISDLFTVTSLSVCTAWFHNTVTSSFSYMSVCVCVCVCVCVPFTCRFYAYWSAYLTL
jgi:hypothetical protein